MRRTLDDSASCAALALGGALFLMVAALSARLAVEHMRLAGEICGYDSAAHCVWCGLTLTLALLGGGLITVARQPRTLRRAACRP